MTTILAGTICNPLIRRGIDLCRLYRRAASAVNEPGLRAVLEEDAQTLAAVIADVQHEVEQAGGEPRTRGSWRAALRWRLFETMAHAGTRRDSTWIRELAQDEAALLRAFERAIAGLPEAFAKGLRRQLPRLRGIHLDMHDLASHARS
ncbi:PA2169 family four-helix-bundle protein [Rhodanobacter sp. 7MK24]|uniref:PA2169 family four-helix-bundle protein n=1 Tax=Rhodanobacter sp. 7MK24 TaxID=2775922 RepID=UPI0017839059|nr:PA2169 family four-helix-bundle protein [Rhodanobacter sp. 7MK24]MBD8881409.1 PA2169 family four-helix-bundle protein [Rhodanobacter sp. 7MK24]